VQSAISGFRRNADEICALLGYYAAENSNPLPTFRDNVSVPSSRARTASPLKIGPIRCLETSVKDYHSALRNIPEECKSLIVECVHFNGKLGIPSLRDLNIRYA
jgi:hypothetical protein